MSLPRGLQRAVQTHHSFQCKAFVTSGRADGVRSWDATCVTPVGLSLGNKFPPVLTAPTCLGVPGLNAVRRWETQTLKPSLPDFFFFPIFGWDAHSPSVFSPALAAMPTPFLAPFSLQLKKLLLSPSPPSCEVQRDGSARRPGTPKSRPARPCTKVLPLAPTTIIYSFLAVR